MGEEVLPSIFLGLCLSLVANLRTAPWYPQPSPICPNVPILTKVRGHGCPVSGGRGHGGRHRAGIGVSGAPMQGGQGDGTQGARVGGDGVL